MLIQVIQGKVKDADLLRRQEERWHQEIEPSARGYLGYTGGITPDGRSISLVRFESAEAAQANSDRAEQAAWWNETAEAYDGNPTFHDCREVDTLFGGGSNDAGFVQVVQGRAKDQDTMRRNIAEMEATLRERRPDILGMTIAWHGDGGGFTQAVYFRSEEETRLQEKATEQDELRQEYMDMFEGQPVFFDLPEPQLY
jgi:hypothetical protein